MKFKDFLSETANASAKLWLKEFIQLSPVNPHYDGWSLERIWTEADQDEIGCEINEKTGRLSIWGVADVTIDMRGRPWYCPLESNDWDPDQYGVAIYHAKFEKGKKLENIPNVSYIVFNNCEIETFETVGDPLNDIEDIEIANFTKVHCGLLRFLKKKDFPKLENLHAREHTVNDKLSEAIKIVNDHLADGDIIECQTALIDAGFEEWAKL